MSAHPGCLFACLCLCLWRSIRLYLSICLSICLCPSIRVMVDHLANDTVSHPLTTDWYKHAARIAADGGVYLPDLHLVTGRLVLTDSVLPRTDGRGLHAGYRVHANRWRALTRQWPLWPCAAGHARPRSRSVQCTAVFTFYAVYGTVHVLCNVPRPCLHSVQCTVMFKFCAVYGPVYVLYNVRSCLRSV